MMKVFRWVREHVGEAIVAVGALHSLAAWTTYIDEWSAIRAGGFWDSVPSTGTSPGGEALWFAVAGVSYMFTGLLVREHLRATGALPMGFAAGMTVVALGICIAMPASGAWLALACGVLSMLVAATADRSVVDEPTPRPRLRPEDLVV